MSELDFPLINIHYIFVGARKKNGRKKIKAHNRSTALEAYLGDVCKQKSRHKHTATDTENIIKSERNVRYRQKFKYQLEFVTIFPGM